MGDRGVSTLSRPSIYSIVDEWRCRPRWHADAVCREYPSLSWYPAAGQSTSPLVRLCRMCLVRTECLLDGLQQDEEGIWGGATAVQRRQLATVPGFDPCDPSHRRCLETALRANHDWPRTLDLVAAELQSLAGSNE